PLKTGQNGVIPPPPPPADVSIINQIKSKKHRPEHDAGTMLSTRKRNTLRLFLLFFLCIFSTGRATAQDASPSSEAEVTFRFVAGKDMLFSPWGGNGESLRRLSDFIRMHRESILSGETPIFVYGYCASAGTPEMRLRRARLMSNRVKSEMILHDGLREEHFRTENFGEVCGELRNAVVVRLVLPQKEKDTELPRLSEENNALNDSICSAPCCSDSISSGHSENTSLCHSEQSEDSLLPASSRSLSSARGWSFGLNLGIPFFWGDMASMSADKTYLGFGIGVQAETRFSSLLGASLSVDYARDKAGAREYSRNYQLAPLRHDALRARHGRFAGLR
ncbi:MAG: hypothetical protein LUE99_07010, partial [Bacteroides sp.]|nr:hypothetical protein [Bacteroides sp.]